MKIAVIGSRGVDVNIAEYIPEDVTMIISGGAKGVDTLAEEYADENNLPKLIIKPDYQKYKRYAPLVRNEAIVKNADIVLAFWDGKSKGTKYTIDYAKKLGKPVEIIIIKSP